MEDNSIHQRTSTYFGSEQRPLFGWLHTPKSEHKKDTCVVICYPLALEYMSAYRSMRYLAEHLASEGFPTLRFDYFGTGDSGGYTEDDATIDYAIESIKDAVSYAKQMSGCEKVALIGLRLGATFASLYAENNPVDDLILWAPVESGKRYLREIKALQMSSATKESSHSNFLEAAGMVYWPNTQQQLATINLLNCKPSAKNVLIIPKDDLPENHKLINAWQSLDLQKIEQHSWPGSSGMLLLAEDTIVPVETFKNIKNALLATSNECLNDKAQETISTQSLMCPISYNDFEASVSDNAIVESAHFYDDNQQCFGILSEQNNSERNNDSERNSELPCLIIVNSGAIHRVGSNRMHVLLARQLASYGFSSFRIDIPGLGDSLSELPELENQEHIEGSEHFIAQAVNYLKRHRNYGQFAIMGLSSGAFYSYNSVLRLNDLPIIDGLIVNPEQFYSSQGHEKNNDLARQQSGWMYYRSQIANPEKWKKFISGKVNYRYLFSILTSKISNIFHRQKNKLKKSTNTSDISNELSSDLYFITQQNKRLTFVISENDPANLIINTLAPNAMRKLLDQGKVEKHLIANADHTFSRYRPMVDMIQTVIRHMQTQYGYK